MKTISILRPGLPLVLSLMLTGLASAQAPASATAPPAPATSAAPEEPPGVKEVIVRFEMISLPPLAARKALIKYPKEPELYQWLDSELENKESGVVLERMHALRIRGGQRSKVESINEHAYPTEMDPPQIPQTVSISDLAALHTQPAGDGRVFPPWPLTSTTPSSYTFRNLGFTAEAELTIGEDGKTVDMNVAPEIVRLVAEMPVGLNGDLTQPVHETQKVSSQVLTTIGQPALVSSFSPPVGTGAPGGNKVDRVWLLFVTVNYPG